MKVKVVGALCCTCYFYLSAFTWERDRARHAFAAFIPPYRVVSQIFRFLLAGLNISRSAQ